MTETDREGRLPLHYAAMANDVVEIEARLTAGDDPHLGDRMGFTPLHLAAQEGSLEAARMLLDRGAALDQVNSFGNTPLFVAVFNSRGRGDVRVRLVEAPRVHPSRSCTCTPRADRSRQ